MSKIGLVVEGGGMKCAYSAAILDKFIDDDINFYYAIGVSAGSANVCSYLAGQRGRNKRFYTEFIKDPLYFGPKAFFKTGNLFNLSYIYGTLSNHDGKAPLDYQAIMDNPTRFKIVATNARTGRPVYFDKSLMKPDDYRLIMASCALPGACKAQKLDDGNYYYDGGVTMPIPVEKAFRDGCDKLVVILSKPRDFVKEKEHLRPLYTLLSFPFPKTVRALDRRHISYTKNQKQVFSLEKKGKVFIFAPSDPPKMSTFSMDLQTEEALYDLGLKDYADQKEALLDFLY